MPNTVAQNGARSPAKVKDFKTDAEIRWCPGCGDFGVLAALHKALASLRLPPHELALVTGIGCSGRIVNYVNAYGFHVAHGRTLPAALGIRVTNGQQTVMAIGGDGDAYAIGMGHFVHAVRRNANVTYLVIDNHIYGLTKGQLSPTSPTGFDTRTSPGGSVETPMRPLHAALGAGGTFVAQGFSGSVKELTAIIEAALQHDGFAYINCLAPCVTFNRVNTSQWYREHLRSVDEDPGYDPGNRAQAFAKLTEADDLLTGILYRDPASVSFDARLPGRRPTPPAAAAAPLSRHELDELTRSFR